MRQRARMKYLSTKQVASKAGIGRATLERWLASGNLRRPRTVQVGDGTFRRWTVADVAMVLKYKRENYRKGRGRKKNQAPEVKK
jgi:predicted DNA-binding transcriptional regulator AlpA